jgi:hypothetical protein
MGLTNNVFYLLKVKGKAKIPDYIQVRDQNFTLIGYFRPGRGEKANKQIDEKSLSYIEQIADKLEFGKIIKIEIPLNEP